MTTARRELSEAECPITRAVDVLGDKWTLLILKNANVGMTRFEQFRTDLGIADNILSARLGRMVELGLMVRLPYQNVGRARHEYRLTRAGTDILPILHALSDWGHKHTTINGAPAEPLRFVHTVCGNPMERGEYCASCDVEVPREQEVWVRPWRDPVVAILADAAAVSAGPVSY